MISNITVPTRKVQVGNEQEKAQSEKKIPTPKTEVGNKTNQQSDTCTMKTYRKPNEKLFSQKVATPLPKLNLKYENIHKAPTAQKI